MKIIKAFTLAEVLITLTIIGVVAAITIPVVVQKIEKQENVAKLKKIFSALNQCNLILKAEGLNIEDTIIEGSEEDTSTLDHFSTILKIEKNCKKNTGCLYETPVKYLNGVTYTTNFETKKASYAKGITIDGVLIVLNNYSSTCVSTGDGNGTGLADSNALLNNTCGYILVDVNGKKGPNTVGRDIFNFWTTKKGVFPFGSNGDGYGCDPNSSDWEEEEGHGCAARVLRENDINY